MEYRPLEGFVLAIAPFNFTTFNANLPGAPAIMGNVAILKPAATSVYSAYYIVKLLEAAGLPPGVINFLPGPGSTIGDIIFNDKNFAGLHFTGSTPVFQQMWKTISNNLPNYKSYPRIVGETGGKDFVFAHKSADIRLLGVSLIQGAFEYQGQKCSAASRAYIPKSIWPEVKEYLVTELGKLKTGDVTDFSNYNNAVIDLRFAQGTSGAWYDDLRLHPEKGNMKTYVYDLRDYRLRAILDEENFASLFYYDAEGNLYLTKKETVRGIKTLTENISYQYER